MLDPENVPSVDPQERLSRYIITKRHFNQQTKRPKANAFVPHPWEELSVTRDRNATDAEIWSVGFSVAAERSEAEKRDIALFGRGDALASTYHSQNLKTVEAPVPGNPNHVNATGWPAEDKPAQKLIAQEIAAVAKFVAAPES